MKKTIALLALVLTAGITFGQKTLSNEKIWASAEFNPEYIGGFNSMKNGTNYTRLDFENGESVINVYDYKTNQKKYSLLKSSELKMGERKIRIQSYEFNADESLLLIADEVESIYRHSSKAHYYIWDIKAKSLRPVCDLSKGKISLPQFSPDASKIAFVRGNNLFVNDFKTNNEYAITTDGEMNKIINGMCDWVYEEEFGFDKAWQWNANGTKIAFYRFDESEVREFNMTIFGGLYPDDYRFKYPKAGEKNSDVAIRVYDLATRNTYNLDLGKERDQYIPRIKWTQSADYLCVWRLNRLQNKLEIQKYNAFKPVAEQILYLEEDNSYVEINDDIQFLSDDSFVLTSEKDGFNHIYHYSNNGKFLGQITKGQWDVSKIYGVNESTNTIYYQSSESDPTQRDVYSIKIDGTSKKRLSPLNGTNSADFSSNFSYFILNHSDANNPPFITLCKGNGQQVAVLKDNQKLKDKLMEYNLPKKEFMRIKTGNGVFNAWIIKPTDFDASKKYPVFMTVYQGPGSNTVNNSWDSKNFMWHCLLAQQGYLVVSVDGRGTGNRGAEWKKCTYAQLGKLETEDQIAAAKYLSQLPYVDPSRIGIQGWSFGGYMTLLCMTKGADVFKAGISVAPVTTWRYYDSIYTERYLKRPQDNPEGYDENSPIKFADKLKGKLLLVHGSADDNVHYQNSMDMVDALVRANKPFDLMIYPNKNHGIYGGNTRLHLYNKMTKHILENL